MIALNELRFVSISQFISYLEAKFEDRCERLLIARYIGDSLQMLNKSLGGGFIRKSLSDLLTPKKQVEEPSVKEIADDIFNRILGGESDEPI